MLVHTVILDTIWRRNLPSSQHRAILHYLRQANTATIDALSVLVDIRRIGIIHRIDLIFEEQKVGARLNRANLIRFAQALSIGERVATHIDTALAPIARTSRASNDVATIILYSHSGFGCTPNILRTGKDQLQVDTILGTNHSRN